MLELIRRATFETNSSSCHTLVVNNQPPIPLDVPYRDNLTLAPRWYGMNDELLETPEEKLSYLLTYCLRAEEPCDVFVSKILEVFPDLKTITVGDEVYELHEFISAVETASLPIDYDDSYIDHDSTSFAEGLYSSESYRELLSFDVVFDIQ